MSGPGRVAGIEGDVGCREILTSSFPPRRYDLPEQCRLKMTENDIKTGKELLQEAFIMKNPEWMKELQRMVS